MKKCYLILISILFVILGMVSCDKNDQIEPNFISAKLNEENWNGVPEINLNMANDTLTLLGIGDEQIVVFKIKFNGERTYDLSGTQANYYTTVGGDVITSLYILDTNTSSQITITDYNSEQSTAKGNFTISLLKEWSNPNSTNNSSLNFTAGRFKGIITK